MAEKLRDGESKTNRNLKGRKMTFLAHVGSGAAGGAGMAGGAAGGAGMARPLCNSHTLEMGEMSRNHFEASELIPITLNQGGGENGKS